MAFQKLSLFHDSFFGSSRIMYVVNASIVATIIPGITRRKHPTTTNTPTTTLASTYWTNLPPAKSPKRLLKSTNIPRLVRRNALERTNQVKILISEPRCVIEPRKLRRYDRSRRPTQNHVFFL
jgi:hypothetical protein